jgi:hypothetical protein
MVYIEWHLFTDLHSQPLNQPHLQRTRKQTPATLLQNLIMKVTQENVK